MKIRKATSADIDGLAKLLLEVQKIHSDVRPDLFVAGARKYTDDELKKILQDDSKPIFVATVEDVIAGYAFCVISIPDSHTLQPIKSLYIDDLCVDETFRGHHIGVELYNYVVDYAKKIDCYNVTLNVWADNKNAVAFYEKIGLQVQKIGMEKVLKRNV